MPDKPDSARKQVRKDMQEFRQDVNMVRGTVRDFVDTLRPIRALGIVGIGGRRSARQARQKRFEKDIGEDSPNTQ